MKRPIRDNYKYADDWRDIDERAYSEDLEKYIEKLQAENERLKEEKYFLIGFTKMSEWEQQQVEEVYQEITLN